MAFTRDWSVTSPLDHLKFKDAPGSVRNVRTDLADRLAAILYGFTAGETIAGIKLGRMISIGTGVGSTPPGTGVSTSVDIYARSNGTDTGVELYAIDADGNETQLIKDGKIPLDVSGRLANNTYLIARNQAGDGNVNILKVNTGNAIELASHIVLPDTAPSGALNASPKGYVDAKFPVSLAAPGTEVSGTLGIANGGTGRTTSLFVTGTFTGNGVLGTAVAHGLGTTPKYIRTTSYGANRGSGDGIRWSTPMTTNIMTLAGNWYTTTTAPDATNFYLSGSGDGNNNGVTYSFIAFG